MGIFYIFAQKITKDMEQRLIGREPLLHPHLLFHIEKNIILFNTTIILNIFITFAM